jgi:hypothetical protein
MDKKAIDYYIERKNKEDDNEREDTKESEGRARTSGTATTADDLKKAAQKI